MRGTFKIIGEREYIAASEGNDGVRIISLLDMDTDSIEPVEYVLEKEELKYSGKCRWKKAELAITRVQLTGGGRLFLRGRIVSIT